MHIIAAQIAIPKTDLAIIIVYLIGIMAIGIWAGYRKKASTTQFFLAGKSLKWPMHTSAKTRRDFLKSVGLGTASISGIHDKECEELSNQGWYIKRGQVGYLLWRIEFFCQFCMVKDTQPILVRFSPDIL